MAQYEVTYQCGHTRTEALFGRVTDRTRRLRWLQTQACPECERRQEWEQAVAAAQAEGLPPLRGTEREIEWAVRLRYQVLTEIRAKLAQAEAASAQAVARGELTAVEHRMRCLILAAVLQKNERTDLASWWIVHRHDAWSAMRDLHELVMAQVPEEEWRRRAEAALRADAGGC